MHFSVKRCCFNIFSWVNRVADVNVLKGSHTFTCTSCVHPNPNPNPLPSQPKLVLIYRPRRDERLSWPWDTESRRQHYCHWVADILFIHVLLRKTLFEFAVCLFAALHWMQGGLVARTVSVCPSVCPSVKRVNCDKTEEKSVQIYIYIPYEWLFSLVFWEKEWLVGAWGDPFCLKIWDNRPPLARNRRFWADIRS